MPSIGGLLAPAAAGGIGRSLALARGANPRASLSSSFDQQLDLALRAGVGGGANTSDPAGNKAPFAPTDIALNGLGSAASIESVRIEHRAALAEFEDRFRRLLQEHGIDLGQGIALQADVHGDVRVASNHPHKESIERLFRDDADLRNLFVRLDNQASALRAADLSAELARLQSEAPGDAAAQVRQLLDGSAPTKFSLAVRPDNTLVQFS
jgi:hypothetical protein